MLTIFRVTDTETRLQTTPAPMAASQVSALYNHLLDNGIATDLELGEREGIAFNFKFNANAVSLAVFARLFAGYDQLLAIAEEAQFHGRSLRLSKADAPHFVTLSVSDHIAISPELLMSVSRAHAVLRCLCLDPEVASDVTLDQLRAALRLPSTYRAFVDGNLEAAFDYLARICALEHGNTAPKLAWA
ncbi:hypothetical protein [Novosphingobium gossypii]|uniref:hypothetical protein n=1 Tax=Novosphingobium gossypii TaxID=1604774 RepID=UPI003D2573A4